MSKIVNKIGQKKELQERKIGEKKQNRLSPICKALQNLLEAG